MNNQNASTDLINAAILANLKLDPDAKLGNFTAEKLLAQGTFIQDLNRGLDYVRSRSQAEQDAIAAFVEQVLLDKPVAGITLSAMGKTFFLEKKAHGTFLSTTIRKEYICLMATDTPSTPKGKKRVHFSDFYALNGNTKHLTHIVDVGQGENHLILLFKTPYQDAVTAAMGLAASNQWITE
jgi:hypothetical protein